jgi:hypothetical protein
MLAIVIIMKQIYYCQLAYIFALFIICFWGGVCGEVVERNSTDTSMLLSVPLEINNNNNNNNNSPMILFDEELPAMFSSLVGPPVMLQHPESDYHH